MKIRLNTVLKAKVKALVALPKVNWKENIWNLNKSFHRIKLEPYQYEPLKKNSSSEKHLKALSTQSQCPFSPLPSNKSRRYTTLVFFNLATPGELLTSGIPKSPEVRFLIVQSSLNHFLVHRPAATNSMHMQCAHTRHLQYSSRICIWNPVGSRWWSFIVETVNVVRPLAVFTVDFHRWCLKEF